MPVVEREGNLGRPVVFVPGFMGSRLEREGRGLLPLPIQVWPPNVYSITAQLAILQNLAPLKATGLFGNYYEGLLDFVTRSRESGGLGRTTGEDFWVFAYDWRQSCEYTGRLLAEFIREKLAEANARREAEGLPAWERVDVICHSMGGFVTRAAQRFYDAPVGRAVYIASGHYGFTKAYFALHPATANKVQDDFIEDFLPGLYWDLLKALPNVWYLQIRLEKLLRLFPAMFEMVPDQYYLEEAPALVLDETQNPPRPVTGLENTYYQHGWKLPAEMQRKVWEASQVKFRLGRELPGKHNLSIYAASLPTYAQATYTGRLEVEKMPVGDFTVTATSVTRAQPARLFQVEAPHGQLPNEPAAHEMIRAFLTTDLDGESKANTHKRETVARR